MDTAVGAPGHDAEAVVLDLVNPAATFGRLLGRAGKTRHDEGCQVGRRTLTQHGRLITATAPESSQGCFSTGAVVLGQPVVRALELPKSASRPKKSGVDKPELLRRKDKRP